MNDTDKMQKRWKIALTAAVAAAVVAFTEVAQLGPIIEQLLGSIL